MSWFIPRPSLGYRGPMREAQEKSAELVDVEVGDFVRLCEFAYTGDYTPPKSTVESTCDYTLKFEIPSEISDDGLDASCIEDSPEGHLAPPLSQGHGMEGDRTRSRRKGNTTDKMSSNWKGSESDEESKKAELPEKFKSKAYHRIRTHGVAPKASPEPAAIDALEDFTTVFLGHAPQHSIQRFSTSGSGGVRGRGDRHHWKINALLCSDR